MVQYDLSLRGWKNPGIAGNRFGFVAGFPCSAGIRLERFPLACMSTACLRKHGFYLLPEDEPEEPEVPEEPDEPEPMPEEPEDFDEPLPDMPEDDVPLEPEL